VLAWVFCLLALGAGPCCCNWLVCLIVCLGGWLLACLAVLSGLFACLSAWLGRLVAFGRFALRAVVEEMSHDFGS
jgi:hypothetical protein